ncbi:MULTISPECIES: MarR family winged helix-turn-helix transcriptional regulator [Rhodococcus]|uniref:MarR family winged helix-turn-helix transcriptional regulator n=1 Tax=Rhodococcus TaxID=1827 RepID=UPI000C7DEE3B|nr:MULTISPECIES: MarR family transcriptional regulator [Rhodococcus]AUM19191.1 ArsR family transcriptional regulator [Rhodococcus ruber]MBD8056642.1 winged helix DNA-binding protein [Rhodococcus ruber]MCF8784703.1 MarR family transcriptional regulator [Rhodococcus ruber]
MSDDLESWPTGRLLSTAARLVEQAWESTLRAHGLTHAGLVALHTIADGPRSQREIARACRVTDQTMSRTVEHLERSGLVTRTVDPADERRMRVQITESGNELYRAMIKLERTDAQPTAVVSDPGTLRSLLIELVRSAQR